MHLSPPVHTEDLIALSIKAHRFQEPSSPQIGHSAIHRILKTLGRKTLYAATVASSNVSELNNDMAIPRSHWVDVWSRIDGSLRETSEKK